MVSGESDRDANPVEVEKKNVVKRGNPVGDAINEMGSLSGESILSDGYTTVLTCLQILTRGSPELRTKFLIMYFIIKKVIQIK